MLVLFCFFVRRTEELYGTLGSGCEVGIFDENY